jgi:hypothetical protein
VPSRYRNKGTRDHPEEAPSSAYRLYIPDSQVFHSQYRDYNHLISTHELLCGGCWICPPPCRRPVWDSPAGETAGEETDELARLPSFIAIP